MLTRKLFCQSAREYRELEIIRKIIVDKDELELKKLFRQFRHYILRLYNTYYIDGCDFDDFTQIANIAIYEAINDFRFNRGTSLKSFIMLVIKRDIQTALTASKRKKQLPLKHYDSLFSSIFDVNRILLDLIPDYKSCSPESIVIYNESIDEIKKHTAFFSKLEKDVFILLLNGYTYKEIEYILNPDGKLGKKFIDNAMQRIKKRKPFSKSIYPS